MSTFLKKLTIPTQVVFNHIKTCAILNRTLVTVTYNKPKLIPTNLQLISRFYAIKAEPIEEKLVLLKKRPLRKKKQFEDEKLATTGYYNVLAYSTAEEYNLEGIFKGLLVEDLYQPKLFENSSDVVHAVAKYKTDSEPREMFFFREGTVVLWNINELESENLLKFLKKYEADAYSLKTVHNEAEVMSYRHVPENETAKLDMNGDICIPADKNTLYKYTFSNAIAISVKLGIWEAWLDRYIESIEFITEDLKMGSKIRMTREEALRKHGELFAMRHTMNLSSDLLDVPDFYWDREELESLYNATCSYFSIAKRTKVMNEKINHCAELIELLSSHLNDKHHIRLEWMIIILIMVEVGFEIIHYIDKYYADTA